MKKLVLAVLTALLLLPFGASALVAGDDAFYAITGGTGDKVQSYGFHFSFHFEDDAKRGAIAACQKSGDKCEPEPKIIKNGCAAVARPIRYPVVKNYKITWDVSKVCSAKKRWTDMLERCKTANNGERCKIYFKKCVDFCIMGCC